MRNLSIFVMVMVLVISCDLSERDHSSDGEINLSGIEHQQDYTFPLQMVKDIEAKVILNGNQIEFKNNRYIFPNAGFYTMVIRNGAKNVNDTLLFSLLHPERGMADWGLKAWIPRIPENTNLLNQKIEWIYPKHYSEETSLPMVAIVREKGEIKRFYSQLSLNSGEVSRVKNGVGSIQLPPEAAEAGSLKLGSRSVEFIAEKLTDEPLVLGGEISEDMVIPENTLVRVTRDLTITGDGSLTISKGCVVLMDPKVNIYNTGPVHFGGTSENHILVTCRKPGKLWGGFISNGSDAAITGSHTFFSYSGYHYRREFRLGHAFRQALFQTKDSPLMLSHCFILDHAGQVIFAERSDIRLDHVLIQRVKTGGQIEGGSISINHSVFSDFPDDSEVYVDLDNDGLYLDGCDAQIRNTIFMYSKDDGLDTGGERGGRVIVDSCLFEACFHEGVSLSSGTNPPVEKYHRFSNSTFRNNGQGFEVSYSSSNHIVEVNNCIMEDNLVGIRFGNNHGWPVEARVKIDNTVSRNNEQDIWNMSWRSWQPVPIRLQFINTTVSKKSDQFPELKLAS